MLTSTSFSFILTPRWSLICDSGGDEQDRSISPQLEALQNWCEEHDHPLSHTFITKTQVGYANVGPPSAEIEKKQLVII